MNSEMALAIGLRAILLEFGGILVRVSIAVKRHHDYGNSYKGKYLIGVAHSFRVSVLSS